MYLLYLARFCSLYNERNFFFWKFPWILSVLVDAQDGIQSQCSIGMKTFLQITEYQKKKKKTLYLVKMSFISLILGPIFNLGSSSDQLLVHKVKFGYTFESINAWISNGTSLQFMMYIITCIKSENPLFWGVSHTWITWEMPF